MISLFFVIVVYESIRFSRYQSENLLISRPFSENCTRNSKFFYIFFTIVIYDILLLFISLKFFATNILATCQDPRGRKTGATFRTKEATENDPNTKRRRGNDEATPAEESRRNAGAGKTV